MVALEDQVTVLEKEVYGLNKENEMQNRIFTKFEETLEKLQVLTETLHRLIVQHDERIKVTSDRVDALRVDMKEELKELEDKMHTENQMLCRKFTESETRILAKLEEFKTTKESTGNVVAALALKFESWKYFILGGMFVAGVLLGKSSWFSALFSFFK